MLVIAALAICAITAAQLRSRAGSQPPPPVTPDQARLSRSAHLRFGKGTGHKAALNYGDCFAYALAKAMDAPLLFKGNDFQQTDIQIA